MGKTKIEWTEKTWNPVRGCSRVSEGCRNCYAERQAGRFSGAGQPYEGLVSYRQGGFKWTGKMMVADDHLSAPASWRKPSMVFVCSMSDLFHENLPFDRVDQVFQVMLRESRHTYQILTKRPARMRQYITDRFRRGNPLPGHIWLGTSVEDQKACNARFPELIQTPCPIRFLSVEPMLGPIELGLAGTCPESWGKGYTPVAAHLHWVICGGESGAGARPMHPSWVQRLRDECKEEIVDPYHHTVAFFFKQWGAWSPIRGNERRPLEPTKGWLALHPIGSQAMTKDNPFNPFERGHPHWVWMRKRGKKLAGRTLDQKTWSEYPEARA
jgi:protein gp37